METDILSDVMEPPKLASIGQRIGAALADLLILFVIAVVFGYFWGTQVDENGTVGYSLHGLPALALFVVNFCMIPLSEGLMGQTLGKRISGIKVIKQDGSKTSVGASFVRHLFDVIDLFFLCGLIVAASSPRRQRVGDLVARTCVVRK